MGSHIFPFMHDVFLWMYDFKNDINDEIQQSEIISARTGAGTCMEALRCWKTVFAVVNEELMDNHQRELGERLAELGQLVCTTPTQLVSALETVDVSRLKPFLLHDVMAAVLNIDRTHRIASGY